MHSHSHSHQHGTDDRIGWAFFLNVTFTIIEFIGGWLTNSTAIMADAVHDLGDSLSIGFAWILSRFSNKAAPDKYSYGYRRFSVLGALVNAVWDLYAKIEKKPLWQLEADMSPEELVECIDFTYITDALNKEEALQILKEKEKGKEARRTHLMENGYPAYNTSAGWLGYSDEKIRRLCREAKAEGFTHVKMKVGSDLQDDIRRSKIIREEIGYDIKLMMDANQKWDVDEAIENMKELSKFQPWWIEEPTSPDDVLGHAKIAQAVKPIHVATGEHCQNRVVFKQLMQANAIGICQIDSCRVGGVNEILAILLLAAKFNIPVCPHAGGVGLCEHVQHLSMIDYLCISGSMEHRIIEYVDHLHEHFEDPVVIKNGKYLAPSLPGYSIEMKKESLVSFDFNTGSIWKKRKQRLN